jgi:ribosomal protein S18 acetylase RimI-like enzyme
MTIVPPRPTDDPRFAALERYYDAAPRSSAQTEDVGPFRLFISTGMWPYYARPRLGLDRNIVASDVTAVRERQRALGVPEALEWVLETTPSLSAAARDAGLVVRELPLLVHDGSPAAQAPDPTDVTIRRVRPEEFDLARIMAVASVAFGAEGTAVGAAGAADRDARAAADPIVPPRFRDRLRDGRTVLYVVEDDEGPVASGAHQPVDAVTEIVGVATLPTARRRGLGAAITRALLDDARAAGLGTIFLSAAGDDVARIYERLGFVRIGHAGLASPPGDPGHS